MSEDKKDLSMYGSFPEWHPVTRELPDRSESVLSVCTDTGYIINVSYSKRYQRFNCRDYYTPEEAEKISLKHIVAWAYPPKPYSEEASE